MVYFLIAGAKIGNNWGLSKFFCMFFSNKGVFLAFNPIFGIYGCQKGEVRGAFQVSGFQVSGFQVSGFQVSGFQVSGSKLFDGETIDESILSLLISAYDGVGA